MMVIEIFNNEGELSVITAAESMHKAGVEIAKHKEFLGSDVTVEIDGKPHSTGPLVDVRRIARNMKTAYIEGRIMGDMEIC